MRNVLLFVLSLSAGVLLAAAAMRPPDEAARPGGDDAPLPFFPIRPASAPQARTVAFTADGALDPAVALCGLPRSCQVNVGATRRDATLVEGRGLVAIEVEVRWSPASPATQRLTAHLLSCGGCSQTEPALATATGTSPLRLAFEAEDPVGGVLTLRMAMEDRAPGPPEAYASPAAQPFAVAGLATYR